MTREAGAPRLREIEPASPRAAGLGLREVAWLAPFVRPHWRLGAVAAALTVSSTAASLVLPMTFKGIADAGVLAGDQARLNHTIWTIIVVLLFMAGADYLTQVSFVRFQQQVILGVYRHLVHRLLHQPKAFFDAHRTGYLMSRAVGDVFELRAFFSLNVINIVTKTLQLVCAVGILFYLHWRLTLLSLAVLPLFVALTQMFGGRLRRLSRDALERNALVSQNLEETLSATGVIKAFGSEGRETDRVATTLEDAFAANYRRTTAAASYGLLSAAVNALGIGGVLWYGASRILAHELTIGELLAFSAYLGLLIQPVRFLAGLNVTMQQALAAMERVLALMTLIPEDEGDEAKQPVARLDGRVAFEHVTFSYGGAHPALRDVSFTAGPRMSPSSDRAARARAPGEPDPVLYQGTRRISFDGILSIRCSGIRCGAHRPRVAGDLPFDDTVATNIRYGRPDTPTVRRRRARGAGRRVHLGTAGRYQTRVGERGAKLSAGQKQRIAIARALLRDPDILILDEATSALDALTEHAFHAVLKDLGRQKTVFVVAHHLSTVLLSDSVLVLEEGRVVQRGTHEELWRQGGLYGHLCDTQLAASHPVRA